MCGIPEMKFLGSNLLPQMTTPYNGNDTQRTIHDCIGLLAFMPNEPIIMGNNR